MRMLAFPLLALIAEGVANFGIEVVFPGRDRLAFERDRLFPIAGLDRSKAEAYFDAYQLVEFPRPLLPSAHEALTAADPASSPRVPGMPE
jgi:hypothetical protein